MLIRSQDKMFLMNLDSVYRTYIEFDNLTGFYCIKCNACLIGTYSTKEKALKVLDMIQEEYSKYIEVKVGSNLFNDIVYQYNILTIPKVFEMPADDSEVFNE